MVNQGVGDTICAVEVPGYVDGKGISIPNKFR
jgi:hypothetical protein